jgi:hypothetical protein
MITEQLVVKGIKYTSCASVVILKLTLEDKAQREMELKEVDQIEGFAYLDLDKIVSIRPYYPEGYNNKEDFSEKECLIFTTGDPDGIVYNVNIGDMVNVWLHYKRNKGN